MKSVLFFVAAHEKLRFIQKSNLIIVKLALLFVDGDVFRELYILYEMR
jgi:hypothetical protein